MSKTARQLAEEIRSASSTLESRKSERAELQRSCQHQFSKVVYDPIVREGYRDPGDPEGTMGIDRRLPFYVERSETRRWRRTCPKCELTQTTQRTKTQQRSGSVAGTFATEDVPDFG